MAACTDACLRVARIVVSAPPCVSLLGASENELTCWWFLRSPSEPSSHYCAYLRYLLCEERGRRAEKAVDSQGLLVHLCDSGLCNVRAGPPDPLHVSFLK